MDEDNNRLNIGEDVAALETYFPNVFEYLSGMSFIQGKRLIPDCANPGSAATIPKAQETLADFFSSAVYAFDEVSTHSPTATPISTTAKIAAAIGAATNAETTVNRIPAIIVIVFR